VSSILKFGGLGVFWRHPPNISSYNGNHMTIHLANSVNIRWLGKKDYMACFASMKQFTEARHDETLDEIWLLEHSPVFTQGQNGKAEHILNAGDIPVVQTDRGGQITYHGPGQLMVYTLVDLRRKRLNVREFVTILEQSVIDLLADEFNILGNAKREAPGVYVNDQKICSLGLRVKRGCVYHGLAFNIAMDLKPFSQINPCGFTSLKMTQLKDLAEPAELFTVGQQLINYLMKNLNYDVINLGQ
jgi:lipoyl(octanoyl) transferase